MPDHPPPFRAPRVATCRATDPTFAVHEGGKLAVASRVAGRRAG